MLVAEDLFKTVLQYSGAGLSFHAGEDSTTYMVGHALSLPAINWCSKHFRDFHYQDSTDEPLEGFDPSLAKTLDETFIDADCPLDDGQKEYVKDVLSIYMQGKRGKAWNKALGRSTNYAKVGLSYRCLSWDFDSGDIALLAARKLFGLKIPRNI